MNSQNFTDILYLLDKKNKEMDTIDPWLIYVANNNSCSECQENHGKRFRTNAFDRPALPIHPNCKCRYELLNSENGENIVLYSATVKVDGINSLGGIKIFGTDDMLDKLSKIYLPGTLHELNIVNHGEFAGEFELGSAADRLDLMNPVQIKRLKKLLAPGAIIDLRMCYGISKAKGEIVAQKLANTLGCKIKAYKNQVSPSGTRPAFPKDFGEQLRRGNLFYDPEPKIFYPQTIDK